MTKGTIVLAHGLFGFGDLTSPLPSFVSYFNGVAAHLRRQGHTVIAPRVNPIGAVAQRADQLASAILGQTQAGERVHIIAHSLGGLDARHALVHRSDLAKRVATLVAIGTPHRGSPVADAVVNHADPLFAHLPTFLVGQLECNVGALHDLTTESASHRDDVTPDVDGVRYIDVAGDASKGGHELFFLQVAALIGRITKEVNDGVVTRRSALRPGHTHLPDWPLDHAGEIGWSLDSPLPIEVELPFVPPPPHFARYDAIVGLL
jgi:triacylglycerol lipase